MLALAAASPALAAAGDISTVAGNGASSWSGDGGSPTAAGVYYPNGTAVAPNGDVYIAETDSQVIRKITASTGKISTVAGTAGLAGSSGDNGAATSARLSSPTDVVLDAAGNLYIADYSNHRIRKVSTAGVITTFAGTGTSGYSGDGGQATSAKLTSPSGLTFDSSGNLVVADAGANVVRSITPAGVITTLAGTGTAGYSGDGLQATLSRLALPSAVDFDAAGNLFISDRGNNRVRKVALGVMTTYAGNGTAANSGDGGQATSASISDPTGIEADAKGDVFVTSYAGNKIREIAAGGTITTVAGTGTAGFSGDGGAATSAMLHGPASLTFTSSNELYVGDSMNNRVRKIAGLVVPDAPVVSAAIPASPANDNAPAVTGSAAAGATVKLYTNSSCSSAVAASGDAATFASGGIPVAVADDSTTSFWATATDSYGNASACSSTSVTYVEDSTAPAAPTLTGSPATPGSGRNPSWSFSAESGATLQCRLTNSGGTVSDWASCGSPRAYSLTGQPDDTYTLHVKATDAAGNTSGETTGTYRLDTTAPAAPSIDSAPMALGNGRSPTWGFSGEAGASFQCELTQGATVVAAFGSCTSPLSYSLIGDPDGTYTFHVKATDAAGNTGDEATSNYTLDSAAPAVPSITSSPGALGNVRSVEWDFSGEPGVTFQCRLARGTTVIRADAPCSSPESYDLTGQPDGSYVFSVTATDSAGNTSAAATSAYTLDTSAPAAPTITASPGTTGSGTSPAWSFSGEAGATLRCELTTGATVVSAWADCTSPRAYSLAGQPDATYTFHVEAVDGAGNTGPAATDGYTLDGTAPATPSITSAPPVTGNGRSPSWSFTGVSGVSFECQLSEGATVLAPYASCTSPYSPSMVGYADGTYTFSVRTVDGVGNRSAASTSDYTLDTAAPAAPSFSSTPGTSGNDRDVSWQFDAEAGASFRCRLDHDGQTVSAWAGCTTPAQYSLADGDGTYTFSVTATDAAGNASTASSSNYALDATPPAAPAITPQQGATGQGRAPAWAYSGESGATFRCELLRGATVVSAYASCGGSPRSYDLTGQPDGTYTISVYAADALGNSSDAARSDYVLDTTAPVAPSITSAPGASSGDRTPTWEFSSPEPGARFECRLDLGGTTTIAGWSSCSSPQTYDITARPQGTYTFSVRAIDAAANTGAAATGDYTVSSTPPSAPQLTASPNATGSGRSPAWAFSGPSGATFECRLDRGAATLADWTACTSPRAYDLTGQPDGSYAFSVRAVDVWGNLSPVTAGTYVLDTSAPAAPAITAGPAPTGSDRTPSWSFSGEPGAAVQCRLTRDATTVSDWSACGGSRAYDLTGQPDGGYVFAVRAVDAAGNAGPEADGSYALDTLAPGAPVITSSPGAIGSDASPTWRFTGEPGATLQCDLMHGTTTISPPSPCATSRTFDLSSRPDGRYRFEVRATDIAGNPGLSATDDYQLDTTPPGGAHVDGGPGASGTDRRPSWSFSGPSGLELECKLVRGQDVVSPWRHCTSPRTYDLTDEPDGSYVFYVRTVDAAGNAGTPDRAVYELQDAHTASGNASQGPNNNGNPNPTPGSTPITQPTNTPATPPSSPSAPADHRGPSPRSARADANASRAPLRRTARTLGDAIRRMLGAGIGSGSGSHEAARHKRHHSDGGPVHAVAQALQTLQRAAPTVAKHSAIPSFLLLLVVGFLGLQNRIDRGDPKLALAPVFADPDLGFDPPGADAEAGA